MAVAGGARFVSLSGRTAGAGRGPGRLPRFSLAGGGWETACWRGFPRLPPPRGGGGPRRAGARGAGVGAAAGGGPTPAYFATPIRYGEQKDAYRRSFYPGAALEDDKTISFGTDNWYEMLRFYHFVL